MAVCERPDQKGRFEQALAELTGQRVVLEFTVLEEEATRLDAPAAARAVTPLQRVVQVSQHAMIRRATELFGARPVRVDEPPEQRGP